MTQNGKYNRQKFGETPGSVEFIPFPILRLGLNLRKIQWKNIGSFFRITRVAVSDLPFREV